VQVGEQQQVLAQESVLAGHGLLDLHDHVGRAPHVSRGGQNARAGRLELLVGQRRAAPGACLDDDAVTLAHELLDTRGRDRHTVLLLLDLRRNTDAHA
jgi:hypothetical protein